MGRELKRVDISPTTSATFVVADEMIVDGDVAYPGFAGASTLAGNLNPPRADIGRVAYSLHGGQVADVPLDNGATKILFNGPIPDDAVDQEVQVPLSQHGCQQTCQAIQVFYLDGSTVESTCVYKGQHFDHRKLVMSPDPPCI
jgi:hypothetical protein